MFIDYLQQGISAFQSGDLNRAVDLFVKQLKTNPKDPNASQLLGLAYFHLKKTDEAIKFMKRSLKINKNQPHVYNNLGAALKEKQKISQAIECYREAINQKEDYIDAYLNLIKAYIFFKKYDLAMQWVEAGLNKFADDVNLLRQKTLIFLHTDQHKKALPVFEQLLQKNLGSVDSIHDYALCLRISGRAHEAIEQYKKAIKLGLENYQLFHNLANAYSDIGELEIAIKYYKEAIKLNPGYVDSHVNLNELYWESDKKENLFESFLKAFEIEKNNSALRYAYVKLMLRLSYYEKAYEFLNVVDDIHKSTSVFYKLLAKTLNGLDRNEDALAEMQKCIDLEPDSHLHLIDYAILLIENNELKKAENCLKTVLKKEPFNQTALAYKGVCWRLSSEKDDDKLNDYQHIVREYKLGVPKGFASIEEFCEKLKEYLDSIHTGKNEPLEQSLRNGTQTRGNLFDDQNELIQKFIQEVRKCLDDYIQTVPQIFTEHERGISANNYIFSASWSVKLRKQGFHVAHIHPMGRVSSAFYLELPDDVEDEVNHQGWFQVGQPAISLKHELKPVRYVKPEIGKLVFFPSYVWHGTIPFNSNQNRMTIAFDMIPPVD